jgi:hypothetical protein
VECHLGGAQGGNRTHTTTITITTTTTNTNTITSTTTSIIPTTMRIFTVTLTTGQAPHEHPA